MPSKHWKEAAEYAEDMARYDRPWELWEARTAPLHGEWFVLCSHPNWLDECEYRRRPRTIRIGEYDVPEPMREKPIAGELYYTPEFRRASYQCYTWQSDPIDRDCLSNGLCHLTAEAAELHAKALLIFTRRGE